MGSAGFVRSCKVTSIVGAVSEPRKIDDDSRSPSSRTRPAPLYSSSGVIRGVRDRRECSGGGGGAVQQKKKEGDDQHTLIDQILEL